MYSVPVQCTWMQRPIIAGCDGVCICGETSFEISELGNMLKSLVVSSVVNIVIHFTDGLRNSRNRDLLTVCSE